MKKAYKVLIVFVISLLAAFLLYAYDVKTSDSKVGRFAYQIIFPALEYGAVIDNSGFSEKLNYEYFSNEYQSQISKEEYEKINTIQEAARVFNEIDINVNINSFNEHRYLNTKGFKTPIGNSYKVDNKYITIFYHVIVGIENGNSVIKKLNIEIIED